MNVDDKAYADQRFTRLGARLKINRHEALGRCLPVWNFAYQQRSEFLPADDIDAIADLRGFARAMIAAELAESKRGKLRLRGVRERIEFLLVQDEKRERALAEKRRRALLQQVDNGESDRPAGRPGGHGSDEKKRAKRANRVDPGGRPAGRPYSPDQDQPLAQDPAPDPDPEARELAEAELAVPGAAAHAATPGGWVPPAGGKAEQAAQRRVDAGELDAIDVRLCWDYCVSEGVHRDPQAKADARAAALIKKQRRRRDGTNGTSDREPSDDEYARAPWEV